jgi:hypothetical protein
MAGMTCFKNGERSRLICSFRVHRGRKGEPKGFTWQDYRDLIVRAHNQLKGPIVLVWDCENEGSRSGPRSDPVWD